MIDTLINIIVSPDPATRDREYRMWKKAVTRTFDWVEGGG